MEEDDHVSTTELVKAGDVAYSSKSQLVSWQLKGRCQQPKGQASIKIQTGEIQISRNGYYPLSGDTAVQAA